ncbi:uncharacterized protein BJ171DRAFT_516858 [Polychytrium aggregatum]|uniref:uncharacterized protein n=1 Tax=Polychytrium aggregatum TaxID=110093 RepID=UPI0022FE78E0|nr:uncharacterized protein BJ171DRAFT_516858 [Polychytrium aggregatum]KAI9201900.1 hypothetical protein BJ171DRAFT_516858 [Polychytrium aggregatum]
MLKRFFNFHLDDVDPECFVTSSLCSPYALFYYRCGVFITSLTVMIISLSSLLLQQAPFFAWISAFTDLSWIGLVVYFGFSTVVTGLYIWRNGKTPSSKTFIFIHWSLYLLPAVYHWIVPVVFWAFLAPYVLKSSLASGPLTTFVTIVPHSFDWVFMFIEFLLNRIPIFYSQWYIPILFGVLFVVYVFYQHAVFSQYTSSPDGFWVYPFLDTSKPYAYAWYLGIAVYFAIIFLIVASLHKLRDRLRKGAVKSLREE